jgi:hypothetical protein
MLQTAAARDRGPAVVSRGAGGPLDRPDPMRLRGFVPLDELVPTPSGDRDMEGAPAPSSRAAAKPPTPAAAIGDALERWDSRTSLFGEPER